MADKATISGTVQITDGVTGKFLFGGDFELSLIDSTITKSAGWRDTYPDGNTPANIIPSGFTTVQVLVIESNEVIELKLNDGGSIQTITGKLFVIFGGDFDDIQIDNNSGQTATVEHLLGAI